MSFKGKIEDDWLAFWMGIGIILLGIFGFLPFLPW